jgi:hypothetical protein
VTSCFVLCHGRMCALKATSEVTAEVADESSDLLLRALALVSYLGHGRPAPGTDTGRVRISPV